MNWHVSIPTGHDLTLKTRLVTSENLTTYCEIGIQAYLDHYTHLWEDQNPAPYFNRYYLLERASKDLENPAFVHGFLEVSGTLAGIFKLDLTKEHPNFFPGNSLFLEKLYLKKAHTGCGYGGLLLRQFMDWGLELNLGGLWLETMFKGPARQFYLKQGFRHLGNTAVPYPQVKESERAMWIMGIDLK
ncbi:MAG: hypothetical protein RLZZ241_1915 [Bacteroidota bacterium]